VPGTYTHLGCAFEFEFENGNQKMVERRSMEAVREEVAREVREALTRGERKMKGENRWSGNM